MTFSLPRMYISRISSVRLAAVLEVCSEHLDFLETKLDIRELSLAAPAQENTRLLNFRKHNYFIMHHISRIHLELGKKQNFSSLEQVVEEYEQGKTPTSIMREEKRELQEEFQQSEKLKYVQSVCQQLANDLEVQIIEKSRSITKKKKILEKTTALQLEQTQKEANQSEMLLEKHLELLHNQLSGDIRLHEECEIFLLNQNEKLQQHLNHWQKTTKQMQQEKEQELNDVQCKRTIHADRFMEKKRMFEEMKQVVVEDREKEERLQQQQAEVRAATKLQAWWRACMDRHGMSSLKKSEEGKKGKKKQVKRRNKK